MSETTHGAVTVRLHDATGRVVAETTGTPPNFTFPPHPTEDFITGVSYQIDGFPPSRIQPLVASTKLAYGYPTPLHWPMRLVSDDFTDPLVVRITREHGPRPVTELWAWIVTDANGGEGVAACEMDFGHGPMMMPLVGADEARIRSLEPQARMVAERTGLPVKLRRFGESIAT